MAGITPKDTVLCIDDIKAIASSKLPQLHSDFFNDGSTHQVTVRENSSAFSKYRLRPRVLVDVSRVDTTTSVLGQTIDFPLCVSPAGLQGIAHPDGELATSRACAKRKVHMGVSSFSNHSVEQVRAAGLEVGPLAHAMQLYTMQDRQAQLRIIRRAEAAGCAAILLTADSPVLGVRYREVRNDFRTPEGLELPMLERTSEMIRSQTHDNGFTSFNSDSHSWTKEIPWLRSVTKMQIWIKGVLTAEDVHLATHFGCDGILVSNHGGRQLDETPATIDALPECVSAAGGRIPVHMDGGVRSGTDIFKALALGANCVWIGRPVIWGLAHNGEAGVTEALNILYGEFKRCMQLTGCNTIADITRASIGVVRRDGPLARL
ncbi:(S)-2-hydroxy-acid oxidase [Seiridium cupressi]